MSPAEHRAAQPRTGSIWCGSFCKIVYARFMPVNFPFHPPLRQPISRLIFMMLPRLPLMHLCSAGSSYYNTLRRSFDRNIGAAADVKTTSGQAGQTLAIAHTRISPPQYRMKRHRQRVSVQIMWAKCTNGGIRRCRYGTGRSHSAHRSMEHMLRYSTCSVCAPETFNWKRRTEGFIMGGRVFLLCSSSRM